MTSIQSSRLILMVCVFLLPAASAPSYGALVKWTLTDVTLHGVQGLPGPPQSSWSGTATGSFSYDAQSQTIEDWDLAIPEIGLIFTPALFDASASRTPGPPDSFTFNNATGFLTLVTPPLTDAGGTKQLVGGHFFNAEVSVDADVTGGSLTGTAVPEPTSTACMAFGIAALFSISWVRLRSPSRR
jgi:hypothetical protein